MSVSRILYYCRHKILSKIISSNKGSSIQKILLAYTITKHFLTIRTEFSYVCFNSQTSSNYVNGDSIPQYVGTTFKIPPYLVKNMPLFHCYVEQNIPYFLPFSL